MKKVLAIIAGIITGFIIVFIGDATSNSLNPAPANLDYSNRDTMGKYILSIPMYVMIIMVIFWLASSFLGALVASRINRVDWKRTSLITGSILMAAAILNLLMLPHPLWLWLVVIIGYIPAAMLGGWLVRPKLPIPPTTLK